jgi:hypothetical protein
VIGRRNGILVAPALVLVVATSCAKKPPRTVPESDQVRTNVEVEHGEQRTTDVPRGDVLPTKPVGYGARYDVEVLPDYPPRAVEARVTPVTVRVEFLVGTDGLAHDVRATALQDVPLAEDFEAACVAVLDRWRFSPAWRLRRDDEDPGDPIVLMESGASLIFRFDLEVYRTGGKVDVDFDAGS